MRWRGSLPYLQQVGIVLPVAVIALIGLALALLLLLADGNGEAPRSSSPTGIAEVDAIIDAVERQDMEALLGFVKYQQIGCDTPTADGYVIPPTCPEGVPQRAAVDAFLAGACHPGWLTQAEVADAIGWVGDRQITTHAVFRVGEPFAEIEADYRVVLSSPTDLNVEGFSSQLGISDGSVVWLTGWCDSALGQIKYLQETGAELIYLALALPIDIAAAAPSESLPARPDSSVLYVVNEDGGNLRKLLTRDWISNVQWSPDGEEVAFVMKADGVLQVAAMPVDGDEPAILRIVDDPTSSIHVLWSSTGAVAILVEGEGEIIERDGRRDGSVRGSFSASRLVAWSPDGSRLLTQTSEGVQTNLQVIDAATLNVHDVATAPNIGSGVARWSPDGEEVSFIAAGEDPDCEGGRTSAIDVVDVDSGERRRVLEPMCADFNSHAWSPDGTQIAVAIPGLPPEPERGVLVLDLASGAVRRLFTDTINIDVQWLSDSRHLAVTRASCWQCGGATWTVFATSEGATIGEWPGNSVRMGTANGTPQLAVGAEGGELLIATPNGATHTLFEASPFQFRDISWSPDDQQIAFVRWPGLFRPSSHIASLDDERVDSIAMPAGAYHPSLAPDLARVAYVLDGMLVVAETERPGEGKRIVLAGRILPEPPILWSPDGEKIALVRQRDQQAAELVVVTLDTSAITVIAEAGSFDAQLGYTWTPDSAQLLLAGGPGQNPDPGLFDIATGEITAFDAPHGDWSPDGSEIVFTTNEDVIVTDGEGNSRSVLSLSRNITAKAAWSPDGETIAVLQLDFITGGGSLTLVDADGGSAREVAVATLHYGRFAGEYVPTLRPYSSGRFTPLWSPDGSQIAIPFLTEEGHGVFLYDVGTGELRPVSLSMRGSYIHLPRGWSPDGGRMAFELVRQGP